MQTHEIPEFDRAFARLCAGFDVPPTPARKDAYWQAFRKLTVGQFTALIDGALSSGQFDKMPTVGALAKSRRQEHREAINPGTSGPTLLEQLVEYVLLTRFPSGRDAKFSPDQMRQTSQPWTYLHREWRDEKGERCTECNGVLVPAAGALPGFRVTVADMLGDPLHEQLMQRLGWQTSARGAA